VLFRGVGAGITKINVGTLLNAAFTGEVRAPQHHRGCQRP
jgi:fructose/tagatose bisphosphate aldolase